MKKMIIGSLLLCLLAMASSCEREEAEDIKTYDCSGVTPTYTADIKAILDNNCAFSGCHNSTSKANGIDLSTYAVAKSESEKKRFRGAIQRIPGYDPMPKGSGALDEALVEALSCWVQNGQPE